MTRIPAAARASHTSVWGMRAGSVSGSHAGHDKGLKHLEGDGRKGGE